MRGLYIHIPFCASKCGYCDFYSFVPKENEKDGYLKAVLSALNKWGKTNIGAFDTIYFGGGTPSFFGGQRLSAILAAARDCFKIDADSEITVECNPSSADERLMYTLKEAGVNRISMGVQSAISEERYLLGRKADCNQVVRAIEKAKKSGITNISLDLMLGIPSQTMSSLENSLAFIAESGVKHVSAYMLKIEQGTPLFKRQKELSFPDEDEVCEMYLHTVKTLENSGIMQYEISNFAVPGYESRHNLKYWKDEEYLGIGPSAHSFIDGKRFYYKRDIKSFIDGAEPIDDGFGGGEEEYVMLGLRLKSGINRRDFLNRFNKNMPEKYFEKANSLEKYGLTKVTDDTIRLTANGFLLSNSIIAEILA